MRISNCIGCGEYKYLARDGKCRNCISNKKLYFGTDENDEDILIKKDQLYRNINISGVTGTGRTTMALNICRQFNNDNEHGVIYFNFKDKLNTSKFDAETIFIGKSDMFHLFNTIRNTKDNNYLKEIYETSSLYSKIILKDCNAYVGPFNARIFEEIIAFLFDSDKYHSFINLHKCVNDLNYRKKIIQSADKKLRNKSLSKLMDYEFETEFKDYIRELSQNIPVSQNKTEISNIINNNKNIVVNFELNGNKEIMSILTALSINKAFKHLELKNEPDKYKSIFILDGFEILNNYEDEIEHIYRHSRHLNASIINIFEYPRLINNTIFNNVQTNIVFRLGDKKDINKIFKAKSYENIINLNNYHYILKTDTKTYNNCTLKNI
jgi:Cdc6-like AAA superfamily ATPase